MVSQQKAGAVLFVLPRIKQLFLGKTGSSVVSVGEIPA